MCGRYTLSKLEQYLRLMHIEQTSFDFVARYNIAPTQAIPVLANRQPKRVEAFHWGLVPSWAKDPAIGSKMINARAETLAEKPAFRTALRRRRCLIPADGFYEWRPEPKGQLKTPFFIRLRTGEPFAFAGLWETWHDPAGSELQSCTIITTTPNELMASLHNRMPVILPLKQQARWLDPSEQESAAMMELLKPYPANEMEAHPVSRRVNSPKFDDPSLVAPTEPETLF